MPIHSRYSDEEFIGHVIGIAREQRASDAGKMQTPDRGNVAARPRADLCVAYSRDSDAYYFGYNGDAGGVMRLTYQGGQPVHETVDTEMAYRRLTRLSDYVDGAVTVRPTNPVARPLANCAEANAVSVALAYGERPDRLFLMAFFPDAGDYQRHHNNLPHPKPPCNNCRTWIGMCYGYWNNGIQLSQ